MRTRLSAKETAALKVFWHAARSRPDVFLPAESVPPQTGVAGIRLRRTLARCAVKGWLEWDGSLFAPAYRLRPAVAARLNESGAGAAGHLSLGDALASVLADLPPDGQAA